MNWYELFTTGDEGQTSYYISSEGDLDGLRWWHFAEGKSIKNWKSRAWIKSTSATKDGPPEDGLANHFGLLVFSKRMRVALEDSGISGVEYLPLRVLKSDDTEYEGYAIANILNFPSALDLDRSDYSAFIADDPTPEDIGRISRLRRAVLKDVALREFHIIRLQDFPEAVYVSQCFVDVYHKHGLTGYSFSPVELS